MTAIARVAPPEYDAAEVELVAAAAERYDGRRALDEASLLSLRHHGLEGKALWVARDAEGPVGFALVEPRHGEGDDSEGALALTLVVAPEARRRGTGRALAQEVLAEHPEGSLAAWSHGNHPAAARLAESLGFARERDLWLMRRPLGPAHPLPATRSAGGTVVRTFVPGQDEDAWLALNAEAFADHPEQGALTRADLEERMAEPWFDPAGFFLAEPADAPHDPEANAAVESPSLLGFHWTKVHDVEPAHGEIYVLGVSPAAQGLGLGRLLAVTGLQHLADRGLGEVVLYVEADNAAAVALYQGLGFTHDEADTDVRYVRR